MSKRNFECLQSYDLYDDRLETDRSVRQAIEGTVFSVDPSSTWQDKFKDLCDQAEGSFELMCMSDKNSSQEDLNKVSINYMAIKRIMQRHYYFVVTGRMTEAEARMSIERAMAMFDAGQDMTTWSSSSARVASISGASSIGGGASSSSAAIYHGSPSKDYHVVPSSPPCISRSSSLRFNTTPGAAGLQIPPMASLASVAPVALQASQASQPAPQQQMASSIELDDQDFMIRTVSTDESRAAADAAAAAAAAQATSELDKANTRLQAAYDFCTSAIQMRESVYRESELLARKVRYSMRACAKKPADLGEVYSTMEAWRACIKKLETAGHVYEFAAKQHMSMIVKRDALDMRRAIVQSAPLLRASEAASRDMSSLD